MDGTNRGDGTKRTDSSERADGTTRTEAKPKKQKALIAMSGGVDSSVAALLLQQEGLDCRGLMMRLYTHPGEKEQKKFEQDLADAEAICRRLGIPFEWVDLQEKFRKDVIERFAEVYQNGKTPNPCLYCNKELKFGSLLRLADERGCDILATGHYARVLFNEETGEYELRKAVNEAKDQSYVLYQLGQKELSRIRFPLGELDKSEVRELARHDSLAVADKGESQDICFIPDGDYASFIERYTGRASEPGDFVLRDGTVLGRHKGLIHYTVGQRKGLGIAYSEALFVLALDPVENKVILGTADEVFCKELTAESANYISGMPPASGSTVQVRTRYRQKEREAVFLPLENKRFKLIFKEAQRAVTPGQAAVLYDGDKVLGGGLIC